MIYSVWFKGFSNTIECDSFFIVNWTKMRGLVLPPVLDILMLTMLPSLGSLLQR